MLTRVRISTYTSLLYNSEINYYSHFWKEENVAQRSK